jgi:hypothetical protein
MSPAHNNAFSNRDGPEKRSFMRHRDNAVLRDPPPRVWLRRGAGFSVAPERSNPSVPEAQTMRIFRWLLTLAILAAVLLFVWPTRFRYDHMTVDGNLVPVRIDRFNGNADMLVPEDGWVPVEGTDAGASDNPAAKPS